MINIDEITTGSIDGTGVFDVLMRSFREHVKLEYEENRITGSEYANVYLQGMNTIIAQSVEYSLKAKATEADIAVKYAQQIIADKQAAMLGMDGVMKKQNLVTDVNHVYTPKYIK